MASVTNTGIEVSYDSIVWFEEVNADVTVGDERKEVLVMFNELLQ